MAALRTVIAWPNDKVYLFHDDDTYERHNAVTGALEQSGLKVTTHWDGLTRSPDAFAWWGAGKAYAFNGPTYVRYDHDADKVDREYRPPDGAPFDIAGNWRDLPASWHAGIDAATNWGNGKLYLFKGDAYLRYDITADRADPGYPRPIAGNWPGVFTQNLTAVAYPGGQHAYFFRGDEYQRFDVDADHVDAHDILAAFHLTPAPSGALAPARLLSSQQANALTVDLIARGRLALKGGLTTPAAGQRVAVKPPVINGVQYTNALNTAADVIDNVDQRMLTALHRLTLWINASAPDVTQLRHLGIGHGAGPANDCHNQGRALDLSAVAGTLDGTPFNKSVLTDWGNLPQRPDAPTRIDPGVDPLAFQLFTTAFRYATYECEANGIGTQNTWPMPSLGGSGFVIYPDYGGDPQLRAAHQNHIHLQVGKTRI
ncbi:hemopexin repeat-containing protein [Streptomyces sp. NPDC002491]